MLASPTAGRGDRSGPAGRERGKDATGTETKGSEVNAGNARMTPWF